MMHWACQVCCLWHPITCLDVIFKSCLAVL